MQMDSIFKNVLKSLCCSYGWSYGVLWSFDPSNSLFLTMQDAYYDEKFEGLIENLRLQVPILGRGIIGQAAFTQKHQWKSVENPNRRQDSSNSICDMFMDDSEFDYQFSSGMKTIAAIPLEPQGMVQFGSSNTIMENEEFVYQTKRMFQEIVNDSMLEFSPCSSSNNRSCPPNELLECLISSKDGYYSNFTGDDHNSVDSSFPTPSSFFSSNSQAMLHSDSQSRTLETWNSFPIQSNSSLPFTINHHDLFDSLPDEILKTNFDLSQWIPPSYQQELIPVNSDEKGGILSPRNGLFSNFGIEEFLGGISGTSNVTMTDEKVNSVAKRRKTGKSIWEMSSLQCVLNNSLNGKKEVIRKKAKPGTRPRPKDRQQILDRMAELRGLIPNGEKMSIDCLLDRTIKHMLFLESVTKHADRIKEADESKSRKDNDPRLNGVTWACELSNQTMLCPLIVEDLGTPGQMLIEMLCEENGFFLEMVDVIRGFGVTILKGVMEVRDKIWARFIVEIEGKRHVTRHEIFSALIQLLEVTCINDNRIHDKVVETGNLVLDNVYCIDL